MVKNLPTNTGNSREIGSIPGSGRSSGEGNGNLLQCYCLENPRDGGAWWAAVSGVAQSRTRLKRLSSSSSSMTNRIQIMMAVLRCMVPWGPMFNYSISTEDQ